MAGRDEKSGKRLKLDKSESNSRYSESKGGKDKVKKIKNISEQSEGTASDTSVRKSPREKAASKHVVNEFVEATKRRNDNWQDEEIDALLNGVETQWDVINAEQTGVFGSKARTEEKKLDAWGAVAQLVNA